jgi:hypothetical protein
LSPVPAPAVTVIAGVSIAIDERQFDGERFDIALSPDGIEIRRPGQMTRRLSWDRVSEWEIEDRRGGVLLTLRGRRSATPLLIPGWTVDELEAVLRDVMERISSTAVPETPAEEEPAVPPTAMAEATTTADPVSAVAVTEAAPEPVPSATRRRRRFPPWKLAVTVTLLAILATAVTLVLLQSAGVIHLSFLGPTV